MTPAERLAITSGPTSGSSMEVEAQDLEDSTAAAVRQLAMRIRRKKGIAKATSKAKRANNHSQVPSRVKARQRSVGDFVKHLGSMGITADASTMLNLKQRTLPGAPGPRTIVLGGGDEERRAAARSSSMGGSASTDDPMGEMDASAGPSPCVSKLSSARGCIQLCTQADQRGGGGPIHGRPPSMAIVSSRHALAAHWSSARHVEEARARLR